jgi:hypothetical protein
LNVAQADAARLLGQVAEALNACERAGITIDCPVDAVMTSHGYVIAVGDPRLGSRWAARTKLAAAFTPAGGGDDD